jgi:hypothetical protein
MSQASEGFTENDSHSGMQGTEGAFDTSGNGTVSFYVQFSKKQKLPCGHKQIVQLKVLIHTAV